MSCDNFVRLAGIAYESLVNGPGIRRVLFAQGCKHKCEGCFNPDTHDLQGGKAIDVDEIIEDIKTNPILSGVTFSGGDCWEQADKFAYMAKNLKEDGLNIWCYTGYTYEQIVSNKNQKEGWGDLLYNIDVLVDGRFEKDKCRADLKYRGSSNQRVIDVRKSLQEGKVITLSF